MDSTLREFGFRIHSRPATGEPHWYDSVLGMVVDQEQAEVMAAGRRAKRSERVAVAKAEPVKEEPTRKRRFGRGV